MKQIIGIAVAIVVLGGAYWWWQDSQSPAMENGPVAGGVEQTMPVPGSDTPEMIVTEPMTATITYSAEGFSPKEITIKKGGTVTWKNESGIKMWVASAMHPSHIVYSGTSRQEHCPDTANTSFDQCAGGDDYSFTFDKAGAWGYHDHNNANFFGKVNVIE